VAALECCPPHLTTPGNIGPKTVKFPGLGYSQFVRHYYGNLIRFLFLRVLRCLSSPGSRSEEHPEFVRIGCPIRESPVRLARQLTEAYRSHATPVLGY
jgi:hypothetical protein